MKNREHSTMNNNFLIFALGGTNTGVMKHVGEAVRQIKVVGGASSDINVIGVATWGIVDRGADLVSEVCTCKWRYYFQ
jgi:hypothetical protein